MFLHSSVGSTLSTLSKEHPSSHDDPNINKQISALSLVFRVRFSLIKLQMIAVLILSATGYRRRLLQLELFLFLLSMVQLSKALHPHFSFSFLSSWATAFC